MDNYTESLYNGIEYIVGNYLSKAGYDRTIQGTILKCVDTTTGKYLVKYQDSKFYAYSANVNTEYSNNTSVFILIPGNDMTAHKTILGAVKNEGLNNNNIIPESARYIEYGPNLITLKKDFGLCSYYSNSGQIYYEQAVPVAGDNPTENFWFEKEILEDNSEVYIKTNDTTVDETKTYYIQRYSYSDKNKIVIYQNTDINLTDKEYQDLIIETNNVRIDLAGIKEYITNNNSTDSLKLGGVFKTNLPAEQQIQGNYGLKFIFLGKQEDTDTIREFTMTIDHMTGDPYRYYVGSEQVTYLDISDYNIIGLKELSFYDEMFPINAEGGKYYNNDIFLQDVVLQSCEKLSNEDALGTYLKITTERGTIFFPQDTANTILPIEAQIWNSGKPVAGDANSLGYYWFEEKANVKKYVGNTEKLNPEYDNLAGNGWACLSPIATAGGHSADSNILEITKSELPMYSKKFLSVAVFNSQKFSKEVTLLNLDASYKIELTTDVGKTLFLKTETANIRVLLNVYHRDSISDKWEAVPDSFYRKIEWYYEDQWGNYKIPDNVAPDNRTVTISLADFNATLKLLCDVILSDNTTGTETIILQKTSSSNEPFTLEIINNNSIFVYDERGISPTNEKNVHPVTITPLKFQIYDNRNGIVIKGEDIPVEKTLWSFPLPDVSLLNPPTTDTIQTENGYDTVLQLKGTEMSFTLDDQYNYLQTANNSIILDVEYRGINLRDKITIPCIKQGDNGTNGTGYSIKIIPVLFSAEGDSDGPWSKENCYLPIVPFKKVGDNIECTLENNSTHWFDVALYFEGREIFRGSHSGETNYIEESSEATDTTVKVSWEFKKHRQENWGEKSLYTVTEDGAFAIDSSQLNFIDFTQRENQNYCHIVQVTVTYKNQVLIASQPIGTLIARTDEFDDKKNDIYLKDNSGFYEVIYQSDGSNPFYTKNYPFTLIEKQTTKSGTIVNDYVLDDIQWTAAGVYFNNNTLVESNNLISVNYYENELQFKPSNSYSGFCLTNAAVGTNEKIQVHLPIHFYLDRYANKAINSWDGNSININEEDGVILSPQVGAGKKEQDNSFTGIVIGVSKTQEEESTRDEVGLFGFSHGQRSVFIDSKDGSATFGIDKIGSIQIKPSINQYGEIEGEPVIQSGNYSTKQGSGIQLGFGLNPFIYYGNKKFMVDQKGALTANGATINGKFSAQNLNSWDKSKIVIGVEKDRDQSEILLYKYDSILNDSDPEQIDRYIVAKTHLAPGIIDLSAYNIIDYQEPIDTESLTPRITADPYTYLKFEDGRLRLKGDFEAKTDSTDVAFVDDSSRTHIKFTHQKIADSYISPEQQKDYNNQKQQLELDKSAILKKVHQILSKESNEKTDYSIEELEQILTNWVNGITFSEDESDKYYITNRQKILSEIKQIIENRENTENLLFQINSYKTQIENNNNSKIYFYKQLDEYTQKQVLKNRSIVDIKTDDYYQSILQDIDQLDRKNQELQNSVNLFQQSLQEKREQILQDREKLRELLNKIDEKIYTEDEIEEDDNLYNFEGLYFDWSSLIQEIPLLKDKYDVAKEYLDNKTKIVEIDKILNGISSSNNPKHWIYAESNWTPSEFYIRSYENIEDPNVFGYLEGHKNEAQTRSELSYDAVTGQLKYIGSVDFQAKPYAALRLTKTMNGDDPTKNNSQLYFRTFFPIKEGRQAGQPNTDEPQSNITLKPGEFTVESRENEDSEMSSLKMKNGKLTLKNVEFALKTPAADVAFMNRSKQTHIKFINYGEEINEDTGKIELIKKGLLTMTPALFQIKAGDSSFYVNPEKNTLNYTGDLALSNSNGIFYMRGSKMALRFGTTVADYSDYSEYENQNLKVTDFSISPTGFSIKAYGKKLKNHYLDTGSQTQDYSAFSEDAIDAIDSGFTYSSSEDPSIDLKDYFNREFIPEDGIVITGGVDDQQNFIDTYNSYFSTSAEDYQKQLESDFGITDENKGATIQESLQNILYNTNNQNPPAQGTDFVHCEDGENGDYIIQDGFPVRVEPGTGNYKMVTYTEPETIDYSVKQLPNYLSEDSDSSSVLEDDYEWGETSGLSYDSIHKNFRLNGNFSVRNEHGSVLLSNDLMRIMFKTYEKDSNGRDILEKPLTRMCIAEESFYFYSFGDIISEKYTTTTMTPSGMFLREIAKDAEPTRGITGAIVWRNGVLKIIGTIYASKGNIGGWEIQDSYLASSLGGAVLNGKEGTLYLKKGKILSGVNKRAVGAIYSDLINRRVSLKLGEVLVEGIGKTEIMEHYLKFIQEVKKYKKELQAQIDTIYKKDTDKRVIAKTYAFPEDVERFLTDKYAGRLTMDFLNKYGKGTPISEACETYMHDFQEEKDRLISFIMIEKEQSEGVNEADKTWKNYGHIYGGYDATDGMVIAAEGQCKQGFTYNISKDNEYAVVTNDNQTKPKGLFFGLSLEKEVIDDVVISYPEEEDGDENNFNNAVLYGEGRQAGLIQKTVESPVISILSTNIPNSYFDKVSQKVTEQLETGFSYQSLNEIELTNERDIDGNNVNVTKKAGSLNFIVGLLKKDITKTYAGDDGTPQYSYVYGTQIMPHVVKTNDIFLTDESLQQSDLPYYHSNSLVEVLKEVRSVPKKISYEQDEEDENIAYVIEEWERQPINYKVDSSVDINTYQEEEPETEIRKWILTLEDTEDGSEKEVKSIALQGTDVKIDLSGFIVQL